MALYASSAFGFHEPYQILVDAEFCKTCAAQKIDVQARLADVLQGTIRPMITQCSIQRLYDGGEGTKDAVALAKEFERRKCGHFKARSESECLEHCIGEANKHRYVVATQTMDLRRALRLVAGTPIVFINRSVVLLEDPSAATMAKKAQVRYLLCLFSVYRHARN